MWDLETIKEMNEAVIENKTVGGRAREATTRRALFVEIERLLDERCQVCGGERQLVVGCPEHWEGTISPFFKERK